MAQHALLSASSSKQWLNCPPSARLQENFPDETSEYALEGTWAHELCEYKIRKYLHERMERPQSEYLTEEIDDLTDYYYDFIVGTIEKLKETCPNPLVMVEEKLDYSHVVPSGFGTGDCVIIAGSNLHIVDFKTGSGVFVDADHNSQMMLYALGALHAYSYLYPVETVSMTIVQPRLENISTCTMTAQELIDWGESIRPIAKLAFEGKGEQKPGDWCRFCRAKAVCRARADEALSLLREEFLDLDEGVLGEDKPKPDSSDNSQSDNSRVDNSQSDSSQIEETDVTAPFTPDRSAPVFKSPALVSQEEIAKLLPILNRIQSWIDAVFAYVSSEAINHGVKWDGYKVVEGRSKREFTDTNAVIKAAGEAGYTDIYKKTLITLTEFEKLLGKKKFAEVLGKYVIKPPGKPTLVPNSDSRPELELKSTAADEFEALD